MNQEMNYKGILQLICCFIALITSVIVMISLPNYLYSMVFILSLFSWIAIAVLKEDIPKSKHEESTFCKLVGHKFSRIERDDNCESIYPSNFCRNCGITKKELEEMRKNG